MKYVTLTDATKRVEEILERYEMAQLADPHKYKDGIRIQVDAYTADCLRKILNAAYSH